MQNVSWGKLTEGHHGKFPERTSENNTHLQVKEIYGWDMPQLEECLRSFLLPTELSKGQSEVHHAMSDG